MVRTQRRIPHGVARFEVRLWGCRCERCGHEWIPQNQAEVPKVCPKCKSAYWNTPRREKATKGSR